MDHGPGARHTNARIVATALRAATRGLGPEPSATHYGFTPLKPTPMQLDGELLELKPGIPVAVDIAPKELGSSLRAPSHVEREDD